MKSTTTPFIGFALLLLIAACNSSTPTHTSTWQPPAPGTTIDSISEPITDDSLNTFSATIKIIADSNSATGIYEIETEYGPNYAINKFSLPKGMTNAAPVLRKTEKPFTYIIGFLIPGDTTFNDYYQVSLSKNTTQMQYIKSYYFTNEN